MKKLLLLTLANVCIITFLISCFIGTAVWATSLQTVSVDKQYLKYDGVDVQTATIVLSTTSSQNITNMYLQINRDNTPTQPMRGYFRWVDRNGFVQVSTSTFVTLLPDLSERIETSSTLTFNFRFLANPSYGAIADNDLWHRWSETVWGVSKTTAWTKADVSFATMPKIYYILTTGQSLSLGYAGFPVLSTTQPYNNLMVSGTILTPLLEVGQESMNTSLGSWIASSTGQQMIVTKNGSNGAEYAYLKKGTPKYDDSLDRVESALASTTEDHKQMFVDAVTVIHGESDHTLGNASLYESYLTEWQHDYETDINAITGQTTTLPMFIDQLSSWTRMNSATSGIPIAQLSAAENNPGKIFLVGPKYIYYYRSGTHLDGWSYRWQGEYFAKVYKKVVVDKQPWMPLYPTSVTRSGTVITAVFHVPSPPLVFDTDRVLAQTNYGFEFFQDGGTTTTITSVTTTASDTVQITLSQVPDGTNQRLRYAYTGVSGGQPGYNSAYSARGNLRDSDPALSQYTSSSPYFYTLYNWAVTFDKAVL